MKSHFTPVLFTIFLLISFSNISVAQQAKPAAKTILNTKANGFRGIWYMIQPTGNEYAFKYSGGLGTYPANHRPFAIYSKESDKTFFCYGGTDERNSTLLHSVSYYDHRTKKVANPTIVLDKRTIDAHDNPVISIDASGYVWIFSTSHGVERPSYISRSKRPYDIAEFELVEATEIVGGVKKPFTNFSYFQVYHDKDKGFLALFSRYDAKHRRVIGYNTSKDGKDWDEWKVLANIEGGHYQVSALAGGKIGVAFDFHPNGKGLDYRTNLYYLESSDWGQSWRTVDQQLVDGPLTERENIALVQDFTPDKLNNYLLDINFDEKGNPLILSVTSKGPQPGPQNGPRDWHLFHVGRGSGKWVNTVVTSSDSNYDMGSIYSEGKGRVRIIGPTETGPQAFNPGGEIAAWVSQDGGERWKREKLLTDKSERNHGYLRRPNNAINDFYGLWADGDGRKESISYIYFTNKKGEVFRLPSSGTTELLTPEKVRK